MAIALLALPVFADDLSFDPDATEACLADGGAETCIGLSADACMESEYGSSTVGMGFCLGEELSLWDTRLNDVYGALLASEREADRVISEAGGNAPPRASALRDMQRAWIGFRDAACVYEYAQWGGGTGGNPAYVACLMRITAEQALALEARLAR
ncbi:MAG: lysozyme inhibitor LprI family protein [Pseudomonadota bacterium]